MGVRDAGEAEATSPGISVRGRLRRGRGPGGSGLARGSCEAIPGVSGRRARGFGRDRARALDPRLASAFLYRGLCRLARSEYEPALHDYTAALGLDQDDATAHNDLAWLYATAG